MVEKEFVMSFERYSNNINESQNDDYLNEMEDEGEGAELSAETEEEINESFEDLVEELDALEESFIEDLNFINESTELNESDIYLDTLTDVAMATYDEATLESIYEMVEDIEDDYLLEAKSGGKISKVKSFIASKLQKIKDWFKNTILKIRSKHARKLKGVKDPKQKAVMAKKMKAEEAAAKDKMSELKARLLKKKNDGGYEKKNRKTLGQGAHKGNKGRGKRAVANYQKKQKEEKAARDKANIRKQAGLDDEKK